MALLVTCSKILTVSVTFSFLQASAGPGERRLQVLWECYFCSERCQQVGHRQRRPIYFNSKTAFVSHYSRTCHICDLEFTSSVRITVFI